MLCEKLFNSEESFGKYLDLGPQFLKFKLLLKTLILRNEKPLNLNDE